MSPADQFFFGSELPVSWGHPAYVFVALSQSWCAHGESVDDGRSVWPVPSENLYFIKCIQGSLAARHSYETANSLHSPHDQTQGSIDMVLES